MAIDYDAMAEKPIEVSDEQLQSISDLADRQIALEDWIEREEERLAEAKRNLVKLTSELLPEAMRAAGVKEFTLSNGAELKLDSKIRANITAENTEWCHNWLRDSGNEAIIRNKFELSFGKDEDERAQEFQTTIEENGFDYSQKESIPWNTLDAFVRAEIAANEPGEEWEGKFGVYRNTHVKIVRPKAQN